ncbi:hypothetical protein QNI23_003830 [Bermanella sp. WJH001]|uniref:hypothetical protein n=1 Tax=Bermanella sp. WJH001 TaxID=3048005 RepID=UPI0024BE6392|nr:hypothetical protein [Bermanella sp. WJH001]MDJ1539611.1 hypothetical protein [Bermanella sp. WJH001]
MKTKYTLLLLVAFFSINTNADPRERFLGIKDQYIHKWKQKIVLEDAPQLSFDTDELKNHKLKNIVAWDDGLIHVFFKKNTPEFYLNSPEHECDHEMKHRYILDPARLGFQDKKELLYKNNLLSIGYECVDYKDYGHIPFITIVRAKM